MKLSAQWLIDPPWVLYGGVCGAWWVLLLGPGLVHTLPPPSPPPISSCLAPGPTASGTSLRADHTCGRHLGLSVQGELSLMIPSYRAQPARYPSCPHPPLPATAPQDRSPRLSCMQ